MHGEREARAARASKARRISKKEGYEEHEEERECGEKEEGVSEEKNGYMRLNQLSGQKERRIVRK